MRAPRWSLGAAKGASDGHVLLYGHGQDHVATVVHVLPDDVHPFRGPGHEGGLLFPSRCHAHASHKHAIWDLRQVPKDSFFPEHATMEMIILFTF